MANPAIERSGDGDNDPDEDRNRQELHSTSTFAAHTTADLIALRDELLEECLNLESRGTDDGGNAGEPSADPDSVRERIDEIHQELAFRDLTERAVEMRGRRSAETMMKGEAGSEEPHPRQVEGVSLAMQRSEQILTAIEKRSRFLDELAHAAREQGQLDQAAAFTLNAQKLDLERVEVLRQLSTLSSDSKKTQE